MDAAIGNYHRARDRPGDAARDQVLRRPEARPAAYGSLYGSRRDKLRAAAGSDKSPTNRVDLCWALRLRWSCDTIVVPLAIVPATLLMVIPGASCGPIGWLAN